MLKLPDALKPHREAGSLNEQINLFGFIDDHTFLTKSGDVGVVLAVRGVDYECLDANGIDHCTKRLESALKILDDRCRIYQYLFKRNAPEIPNQTYANPVVSAAIENRIAYLKGKADNLYALGIYFVVLLESSSPKNAVLRSLTSASHEKRPAWSELKAFLSTNKQVFLLQDEIERAQAVLTQKVSSFILQVNDFLPVKLLGKQDAFRLLKQILNFAPNKLQFAEIKHDTFLDYYLCESHLECHRGFLRIDDFYAKVLTLKEPSAKSFPLIFQKLLEVKANFFITTEWRKEEPDKTRGHIHSRRRHFHNTKRSLGSYLNTSDTPAAPQEILVDDSKEAQIQSLGEALKELEVNGSYFGEFSLTVVVYDQDLAKVEAACAEFYKVFSIHDAQLYDERYNLLNAYLATVPGNAAFNLRRLYITNANHADYSFLFTLHAGEPENRHLKQEYLAVLETSHHTPYFLNLHHRDIAHTVILGRTGSGKSFLLNFLITNLQKYEPHTFIFDLGGSFGSLTRLFGGSYLRIGLESRDFKINPFALPRSKRNLDFLSVFARVLAESQGSEGITSGQERELYEQIQNLYELDDPALYTLSTLGNTLRRDLDNRLHKWKQGGQFGFLFDNAEDTISFSQFQCFDFQGMREYPQLLEPLLFYVLHRADAIIRDPAISHIFKAFFIDEAWVFLKNPSIRSYIVEALKTWRKHNAALVLSTQSLDELRKSDILDVILESCVTKIFLANPDMDRELYQQQFHLNDHEIELIAGLVPKQQMLIKTPDTSKVANLNVDTKSYWLYTNDPFDNRRRDEAFATYGFENGLEVLAGMKLPSQKTAHDLSGRMTMKPLIYRAICLLISVCPLALVNAESAARIVKYSQTDIIPIRAKVRFSTLIVLPADEEILDFTTGDKDFWIINGSHNLCYLHPAQAGIRSNMNLVTASGHVYSFLLTEISKEPDSEPDLKVFVAPNDQSSIAGNLSPAKYVRASEVEAYKEELAQLRNQAARDRERAQELAAKQTDEYKRTYPAKLEFDYSLDKKAGLAPFLVSAIYHDDRFTYIKSSASEKPTIYEIKDKKPNLVNFDLESGVYVVPKIVDNGYLVVGKKRVMFNRHSN